MRQYELMLVFRPSADHTAKNREEFVKKLVDSLGGTVKNVTDWGKKQLAYPIAKQTEGVYMIVAIDGEALKVADIEKYMKLQHEVIRYLLTVK